MAAIGRPTITLEVLRRYWPEPNHAEAVALILQRSHLHLGGPTNAEGSQEGPSFGVGPAALQYFDAAHVGDVERILLRGATLDLDRFPPDAATRTLQSIWHRALAGAWPNSVLLAGDLYPVGYAPHLILAVGRERIVERDGRVMLTVRGFDEVASPEERATMCAVLRTLARRYLDHVDRISLAQVAAETSLDRALVQRLAEVLESAFTFGRIDPREPDVYEPSEKFLDLENIEQLEELIGAAERELVGGWAEDESVGEIETDAPAHEEERSGSVTTSRYVFLEVLGEGGYGKVWRAEDTLLARMVAIKFLDRDLEGNTTAIREARVLAALNHANVITIYDVVEIPHPETGRVESGIIMEYFSGSDLRSRIAAGRMSVSEAAAISRGTLDGLEAIHGCDIPHGDLHDGNVLLGERSTKIIDALYARSWYARSTAGRDRLFERERSHAREIIRDVFRAAGREEQAIVEALSGTWMQCGFLELREAVRRLSAPDEAQPSEPRRAAPSGGDVSPAPALAPAPSQTAPESRPPIGATIAPWGFDDRRPADWPSHWPSQTIVFVAVTASGRSFGSLQEMDDVVRHARFALGNRQVCPAALGSEPHLVDDRAMLWETRHRPHGNREVLQIVRAHISGTISYWHYEAFGGGRSFDARLAYSELLQFLDHGYAGIQGIRATEVQAWFLLHGMAGALLQPADSALTDHMVGGIGRESTPEVGYTVTIPASGPLISAETLADCTRPICTNLANAFRPDVGPSEYLPLDFALHRRMVETYASARRPRLPRTPPAEAER